ncbi:MAG: hypothetical protein OQK09_07505 [Colwellia sp.]|nr:hypothetical protein [Colwellia sp.]MCW9081345.1 hypothetical protein [Colwellia sp.]
MARKRQVQIFKDIKKRGSFDEYPVLSADVDPQLHLSKNTGVQPFYLICEKDTMLSQINGEGIVEFKGGPVLNETMTLGDYIYVPAGTPHRLTSITESTVVRYKAREAGLEATAWYCENCDHELYRHTWATESTISQQAYLDSTAAFNSDEKLRRCSQCGEVHPTVEVGENKWLKIVEELSAE